MSITVKAPPDPHDVTDFRFQGLRKIRIGQNVKLSGKHGGLLAVVPKIGYLLIGGDSCVHVVKTEDVENQDKICNKQERAVENTGFNMLTHNFPGEVLHVGVNCDGQTVSVVIKCGQFCSCILYDTRGLLSPQADKPLSVTEFNTTVDTVQMTGFHWNPALADMFTVTWADGSLALYTVNKDGGTDCLSLPPAAGVASMDWSPKGKQLVVIKDNCDLVQYKPDLSVPKYPKLQEMKTVKGPNQPGLTGVSVSWLSTYEFLIGVRDTERPSCWLITGSKSGAIQQSNLEDICYSTGEGVLTKYKSHNISEWGVVCVASSTSLELGVLGQSPEHGYVQWTLEDNARAEIPLDKNNEECYPVGLGYDTTSTVATPVGEGAGPPSPLLYLLSSDGLLCPYYCVNYKSGAPSLCAPAVTLSGEKRVGTASMPVSSLPSQPKLQPVTTPQKPSIAAAPNPASNFSFSIPSGGTSTPLTKDQSSFKPFQSESKPKPPAFGFSKDPSPAGTVSQEPLKIVNPSEPPSKPIITEKTTVSFSKELTPSSGINSSSNSSKESTPVSDTINVKIKSAIDEEYQIFSHDLKKLKEDFASMSINIGSTEDKSNICTRVEHESKFNRDMIETTKCQNSEIFSLRSSTLETFSWLEEARARDRSGAEQKYVQLLRARPLDPRSVKMMENLRSQFFYCEQQIEEIGNVLDRQWDEHVTKLKRNVRGEKSSMMEELSMAVITNHKILEKHQTRTDELQSKLKRLIAAYPVTFGRSNKSPVKSKAESELDKLAESLRDKSTLSPNKSKLSESKLNTSVIKTPKSTKLSSVTSPVKGVSPAADKMIRAALDQRAINVIKPITRTPGNAPSSHKLIEKLKMTEPPKLLISKTPEKKTLPVYEAVSPVAVSSQSQIAAPPVTSAFKAASGSGFVGVISTSSISTTTSTPATTAAASPLSSINFSLNANKQNSVPASKSASEGFSFGSSLSSKSLVPAPAGGDAPSEVGQKSGFSFSSTGSVKTLEPIPKPSTEAVKPGFGLPASSSTTGFSFSKSDNTTPISLSKQSEVKSSSSVTTTVSIDSTTKASILAGGISDISSTFSTTPASTAVSSLAPSSSSSVFGVPKSTSSSVFGGSIGGASVFGGGVASQSSSVFGAKTTTAASTPSSIFSLSSDTSSSQKSTSSSTASTATITPSSITSSSSSSSSSDATLPITTNSSTQAQDLSSTASTLTSKVADLTKSSSFGSTSSTISTGSIFGASTTSSTLPASATSTTSSSIFGSSSSTAQTAGSVFGAKSTASVFGSATSSSGGSVFGGASATSAVRPASSASSVFGGQSQSTSVFASTTTNSSSGSVFGASVTVSSASSIGSAFGASTTTTTASSDQSSKASIFGGQAPAATSVFGASSSKSGSPFGSKPASSASVFGSATATTTSTSSSATSVFGANSSASPFASKPASSASVFGGANTTTTSSSVFGASSPFGGTASTVSTSNSPFVSTSSAAPTSTSAFGTPSSTTSAFGGGSSFGGSSSGSVFGSSSNTKTSLFTSAPASSGSVFGGSPFGAKATVQASTASPFGSGTSSAGSSVFGGSSNPTPATAASGSVFGGSSSGGGGFLGGLGGTAKPDNANKNPFGASSTFGAGGTTTTTSSGLFGSSSSSPFGGSTSTFGGATSTSAFGSGGQSAFGSGTTGNVASQGFGFQNNQNSTPQKATSGFGASASFGSPPAFGSSASFGGASGSSFGGGATFGGGSGSAFGSVAANAPTFGSAAAGASSGGFGAAANAPTFGSMAGGSAPSFGGSSFGGGGASSPPPAGQQFNSWR